MAEMVSSAVIQETVSQILSGLVQKYEEKEESNVNRNLERLQMAHIWLEAALDISDKWQVTDASLLRWHKKLKRAAQECDDTLHKCKQRIVEGEQMEQEVRKSSFPTRVAHATKSFISSAFSDKSSAIAVTESKGQQCLHSDVTSEQLEKVMLQQAIYHFQRNAEATVYQMLWKYEHNTAYIQVEKASSKMQSTGKLIWGSGKGKISRGQVQTYVIPHFVNMWVAQAPLWLQG
ncbi:unnamed protein product [Miscanthus lutarioriparius]|uniref:Rx N-terminal domain-containing protein n=1 Tax=Miscanthus lutarioriparius TaxID=422564 RepID=A0A811NG39_9POAL|nr:unnamed protein product [Miscanthus lutarioriparius]